MMDEQTLEEFKKMVIVDIQRALAAPVSNKTMKTRADKFAAYREECLRRKISFEDLYRLASTTMYSLPFLLAPE
jgi:hypothetical protein